MALPYDLMFMGSFAYAGYRALGRWLKFSEDSAKHRRDVDFFDSVNEVLDKAAAEGGRGDARMGRGSVASGQGHLFAEWPRMRPEQRAKMMEEMLRVLRLTGQDAKWRHLARAKAEEWSKLSAKQRGELVWAADDLDWGFVNDIIEAADAPPAGPVIWQITDPLPQLSEEPLRAAAPRESAAALRRLVAEEEAAVSAALRAGQVSAAASLEPVLGITVTDSARQLTELRELLQGTLGLSTGGRAKRGQELMEVLRGITLEPSSSAAKQLKEAALEELAAEVESLVAAKAEESARERTAAEARARALAASGVMQGRVRAGRLTPAAASALLSLGGSEISSRLSGTEGELSPGAGGELLSVAALMGGAVAALSSALHDAAGGGGGGGAEGPPEAVEKAVDLCEKLQRELEALLAARARAADAPPAVEGDEAAAAPPPAAAPAALEELAAVAAEVAAVEAPGADQGGEEAPPGADALLSQMRADIDARVAESTAALASRHASALAAARERERAGIVLRRGRAIVAEGEAEDKPSSPVKRLAYAELYLRQLGGRSLGGALPDVTAFVAGAGGAEGIADGLELEEGGAAAARQLQTLVEEMSLIDAVLKLDLGPDTSASLGRVISYLDSVEADDAGGASDTPPGGEDAAEEAAAAAAAAGGEAVATTPKAKAREAAAKCREIIGRVQEDGLVALGLTAAQYRTLAALREAAAALKGGEAEGLAYESAVGALRQAAGQLGEVGAAIQLKLADTTDEPLRAALQAQKERAVDMYQRLQSFLSYEDTTRGPALAAVRSLKISAEGTLPESRSSGAVQAAVAKAEAAEQQVATLYDLLEKLPTAPSPSDAAGAAPSPAAAAAAALNSIADAAGKLRAELASYLAYVILRERALATLARSSGAAGAAPAPAPTPAGKQAATLPLAELEPELNAPMRLIAETGDDELAEWEATGNDAVARGQVAAILVATGLVPASAQQPRHASGAARCVEACPGLPSGKCALQLYAERILRLQQLAAAATFGTNAPVTRPVPFYIMTSPDTHAQITRVLDQRRYFGLDRSQVHVFRCDAKTPCFDADLKAVMSGPTTLAMAPPGSGELLPALKSSGALSSMLSSGVRHADVNTIDDNLLWRPADPVFVGFAAAARAQAAAKVVEPESVAAAYGAVSTGFGPSADAADLIDSVALQAPGVGAYYFSSAALEALCEAYSRDPLAGLRLAPARGIPKRGAAPPPPSLPPNLPPQARAQAIAAAARAAEAAAAPRPAEGYALQRFLADALRLGDVLEAGSVALLGVPRDEEFATLWGRGPHWAVSEPERAAERVMGLHTAWVEAAGGEVACEEGVEVSPLVSYAGEGLAALVEGALIETPDDAPLQGGGAAAGRAPHNAGPWVGPLALAYGAAMAVAVAKSVARAVSKD